MESTGSWESLVAKDVEGISQKALAAGKDPAEDPRLISKGGHPCSRAELRP